MRHCVHVWLLIFLFSIAIIPILLCTDPIENPPIDEVNPHKVNIQLDIPSNTPNGQLLFKIGDLVKVTVRISYPKYAEHLTVHLGEPDNPLNIIEESLIGETSTSYKRDVLIAYTKVGEKTITASVKLKENPSVKTKEVSERVTIGMQPSIEARLIKCSPAQVPASYPCTLSANVTEYGTMSYLWEKNKSEIISTADKKYIVNSMSANDVGSYRFIASNAWGSDTTTLFQLTIASNPKPAIIVQPQDQDLTVGKSAVFMCKATPASVSYGWYRDDSEIPAANENVYRIPLVTLQDNNARFRCKVSNDEGFVQSKEAVLRVFSDDQPPKVIEQPQNVSINVGEKAVFSVLATGTNLLYQWQKNGTDVPGANKSVFETSAVTESDNNMKIRCKVSNGVGSDVSAEATLTVKAVDPQLKPQIMADPRDIEVNEGSEAVFSVIATGKDLRYQWRRNSSDIAGATEPGFRMIAKKEDTGGKFKCVVSNSAGSVESKEAVLTVKSADQPAKPQIVTDPKDVEVTEGAEALFSVVAAGRDLKYQWKKNNTDIGGAVEPTYKLIAKKEDNNAKFRCAVTNTAGMVESKEVSLKVAEKIDKPTIVKHPTDVEVFKGEQATFSVEATGTNLRYQWKRNGSDLSSDTATVLTIKAAVKEDNNVTFSCVVKNSAGEAASNNAKLTVKNRAPKLTVSNSISNGSTVTVKEEETLSFTVTAEDIDVGDKLTLKSENLPQNATFTINGNSGGFSYKPDYSVSKKNSEKQFSDVRFIVEDSDAEKTTVAITIKVVNVNRKPSINNASATVQETQAGGIDLTATDPDEDQLNWRISGNPQFGKLSATSGTISSSSECTYTSINLPATKTENLSVTISDGTEEVSGSLIITINAQNEKPRIVSVSPLNCMEDQASGQLVINGEDPEGGKIYYGTASDGPANGSFNSGTGTYTPKANFFGADQFTITIKDEQGLQSDKAQVRVTVQPVNDPPRIISGSISGTMDQNTSRRFSFTAQDPDNQSLSWTAQSSNPSQVSVQSSSGGQIELNADQPTSGAVTITVTVSDGQLTDSRTGSITVNKTVQPPQISGINCTSSINAGGAFTGIILIRNEANQAVRVNIAVEGQITLQSQNWMQQYTQYGFTIGAGSTPGNATILYGLDDGSPGPKVQQRHNITITPNEGSEPSGK
ncbi:MAG: immunoglobulin domain-containing protein [Chitinivibrionales bacterium]|nr:immunoglobulin domain-containing protein [Chitinivibrionales bacterium]